MTHLIDKSALVAEIDRQKDEYLKHSRNKFHAEWSCGTLDNILSFIDTLEVKEVDDSISKFKSLLHLYADMKSTCADGGYAPNLYFFDDSWHVDWISCTEGDSLIDFTDDTPEGAIQKAYEWFHSTFKNA